MRFGGGASEGLECCLLQLSLALNDFKISLDSHKYS